MSGTKTPPPKRYKPRLDEVSLTVSELTCRCYVWPVPRTQETAGLIVFEGNYRYGSAGSDDALFIQWRLREFCEWASISGLVVDLRGFHYEWGDDFSINESVLGRTAPVRVLVRPEQIEALRYGVSVQKMRTDEEETFAEVADIIRGLRPPDGAPADADG